MRQGSNNGRRPRGRTNRKQHGGGPSRPHTFDSNGPDGRVRGNARQVYEKYLNLARDAQSSGDRIAAEAYFQHAEHYYRILSDSTDPQRGERRQEERQPAPEAEAQSEEKGSIIQVNGDAGATPPLEGAIDKGNGHAGEDDSESASAGQTGGDEGSPAQAAKAAGPKRRGRPRKPRASQAGPADDKEETVSDSGSSDTAASEPASSET